MNAAEIHRSSVRLPLAALVRFSTPTPILGPLLPAMGYGAQQIQELEEDNQPSGM